MTTLLKTIVQEMMVQKQKQNVGVGDEIMVT